MSSTHRTKGEYKKLYADQNCSVEQEQKEMVQIALITKKNQITEF